MSAPALLHHVQVYATGQGGGDRVLRVTYPASSWLGDADEITWEGTWPGTLVGCWHPVTATHYVYVTQDDGTGRYIGVDPGAFEASLAGMTGVEVRLAAGTQSAPDVGDAVELAWNAAVVGVVATHNGGGEVDYAGAFDPAPAAAAGPGSAWGLRGVGTSAYGATELDAPSVAPQAVGFRSWVQVSEAALAAIPATTGRVVGVRFRGTNLRLAVALNGTGTGNPQNATVRWNGYAAGGGSGWHSHYFEPSEVFELDLTSLNELFIGIDGDGGASAIYGGTSQNLGLQLDGGGDNVWRTGPAQGSGVPITTPVGAVTGAFFFGLSLQVIIQIGPYYGSGAWQSYAGMSPELVPVPPNSTTMDFVMPAFGFNLPPVTGLLIQSLRLYLPTHDAAPDDQLRVEIWQNAGGLSLVTVTGDTRFDDVGPTSGTDTGWVETLSAPIDVDGGGEYRVSLKGAPLGPANDTSFGFTAGGYGDNVDRPGWPLAATMEASEIEYTEANGETGPGAIDFNPQVPTENPITPVSSPIFPGNAGAMALLIGHEGIQMEADP